MTSTQPLPERTAEVPRIDQPGLIEFVTRWGALARRAAEADAHRSPNAATIRASQAVTGRMLASRYPWEWNLFREALSGWQHTLQPHRAGRPSTRRSFCRQENPEGANQQPLFRGAQR